MLAAAFIMQGRFSAIADLSDTYIDVSNTYIRPTIALMERLSTMPAHKWEHEKNRFLAWCVESAKKIDTCAQATGAAVDEGIVRSILALQKRVLEAMGEEYETD